MAALSVFSRVVTLAAVAGMATAGIYSDGHWDRSTELATANADSFVKENVDAGKTAPTWNKVVEDFHGNPDVVFGDVSLSKNQVRTIHGTDQGPGSGGWPTIRYFNKGTGYGGKSYPKKTDKAMCDELGPKEDYMQQYVEEQGGTSLCNVNNSDKGCTEKQKDFIGKWSDKPKAELAKQLERLKGMVDKDGSSMKPDALTWAKHRLGIFKQLVQKTEL